MEPFRSTGFGFGAPVAPPPSPAGPAPAPASTNPRLAALQQFLQSQPPEFVAQLRNAISSAPPAERGAILQQAFSGVPGGMQMLSGAADEVRSAKTAQGGGTQTPPINPGPDTKPPVIGPNPGGDGTVTPPIVDPGTLPGGSGGPTAQPLADFDFSPYEGQQNYHLDAGFKKGWEDTLGAMGALPPDQRALADKYLAENSAGVTPGGARGMNLMRKAIRVGMGAEPGATVTGTNPPPPGTNPPPPAAGTSADASGFQMQSDAAGARVMKPRPGTNPRMPPGLIAMTGPGLQSVPVRGGAGSQAPRPTTGPGLQGRPRTLNNGRAVVGDPSALTPGHPARRGPRPTIPNESGQARPQPGVNPRRRRPEPTGY